jgi:hypothetical protein
MNIESHEMQRRLQRGEEIFGLFPSARFGCFLFGCFGLLA